MKHALEHLGIYSDLVSEAERHNSLYPLAAPGKETQARVRQALGWPDRPASPQQVKIEQRWERDGLQGEQISWWVGYGPRTSAWLFKPAGVSAPLPAVLALHDHGGFKFYGMEKIADGPGTVEPFMLMKREELYGGRAWVNALAHEGFAVLVQDVFLWGSRKFPLDTMKAALPTIAIPESVLQETCQTTGMPVSIGEYNYLASYHEHIVSKYLNLLGSSLAGVVCHEDQVALNYLCSRPDVQPDNIACLGLSGGGARAGLLQAIAENLKASVVVGMMSTYPGLLDQHVACHTWMFFPFGWARHGDWPDLVACQAPRPLLVQYDLDDHLFSREGMRAAHARLEGHYRSAGQPEAYTGQFYPGPHKFDLDMQSAAFAWLRDHLK